MKEEGVRKGASDRLPIMIEMDGGEEGRDEETRHRASKTSLNNHILQAVAGRTYRQKAPALIEKLRNATTILAQVVYIEVTREILLPWKTLIRKWPRGRPRYWTDEMEEIMNRRRKYYKAA